MSGVVGQSWYSHNATRNYPLADGPGVYTTDGRPFPTDVIVDAKLRAGMVLGEWIELAGVTVGPALATAVFEINGVGGRRAGGSVSVVGTVVPGKPYAVTPIKDGTLTGWVVFGPGVSATNGWRLADAGKKLTARAGQRVSQSPVKTVTRLRSSDLLAGVVRLLGGQDVSVSIESKVIDGTTRPCVVLRLTAETDPATVFQRYLGPCGARPESGTCLVPPVERIGPAVPDCDGNVNVVFDPPMGTVDIFDGGLGVGHLFGLADVCGDETLGSTGVPGDVDVTCSSIGQGTGAGGGGATVVVNVNPGFEVGRTITLDTGEHYTLTLGVYSAIFHNVAAGNRTFVVSQNPDESIFWNAFYSSANGTGDTATFDLPTTRTFEQMDFFFTN